MSCKLTEGIFLPSSAASPAPWLAKKMEHNSGITSVLSLSDPSKPGHETLVDASRDLKKKILRFIFHTNTEDTL